MDKSLFFRTTQLVVVGCKVTGKNVLILAFVFLTFWGKAQENVLANWDKTADSSFILDEIQVEEYLVSQPLRTIPGSISVVTGEGLQVSDGNNMATVLNMLPGISMQSGTYATNRIVIRGMGSRTPYNTNRIRSYLNAIPLTSSDGIASPEEIDMQSIGRIEVIKGPSSALYGSGLGGTINLFTPSSEKSSGLAQLQYGSFNTIKATLTGTVKFKDSSVWGNASHLQTDGYRENSQFRRTSFTSTAQWQRESWGVQATLLLIDANSYIPSSIGKTLFETNPQVAAANWKSIEGYKATKKALGGVTLTNRISDRLSNRFTAFARWNDSYEKRPFNNLDDQSHSIGFRNKLSYHTEKTDWIFGTEWISEQYAWKLDKEEVMLNENRENRNLLTFIGMVNYRPDSRLNISFATALNHVVYRLTDLFQANSDQTGSRTFPLMVSPRIGLNYSTGKLTTLYASVGHGFSFPSPEETLLPAGDVNPDIQPEQGIQIEVGTRLKFLNNRLFADMAIYQIFLNNLLVTKRISEDIFTGINAGKTSHRGLEVQVQYQLLEYKFFPGKINTGLSFTQSINRFINFVDDGNSYNGKQLPGIPNQSLQMQINWNPVDNWSIETHGIYHGRQFLNDGNTLQQAGYMLFNLKSSYKFVLNNWSLQLFAGINNLSDTRYASMVVVNAIGIGGNEPRYYYPGLPRHAFVGLKFLF